MSICYENKIDKNITKLNIKVVIIFPKFNYLVYFIKKINEI